MFLFVNAKCDVESGTNINEILNWSMPMTKCYSYTWYESHTVQSPRVVIQKKKSKPVQVSVMNQKLAQWNIKFQMRHFVRKSPHKSKAKRKHWHELLDYVNTTDAVACTTIFTNRPFIGLLGPVGDVQKLKKK